MSSLPVPVSAAARGLAVLEVRVLFLEAGLGDAQALDEAHVGDGEAGRGAEHGEHLDVVALEHGGGGAVVDLQHAEQLVAVEEGHADGAANGRAEQRVGAADLFGGVGGEHGGALGDDLAKDAAGDGHGAFGRGAGAGGGAAHAGEHGHVRAGLGALALVAQDDGGVGGEGHELEGGVAEGDEHLVEALGQADLALQGVELAETLGVAQGAHALGLELVDAPQGHHLGLAGLGAGGDGEHGGGLAAAELDEVARAQREAEAVGLVGDGALALADAGGAALGAQVFENDPGRRGDEPRVLGRDVRAREHDVVALLAPDAHHVLGEVVDGALGAAGAHFEANHEARARRRGMICSMGALARLSASSSRERSAS
jgi:hypothetical protein